VIGLSWVVPTESEAPSEPCTAVTTVDDSDEPERLALPVLVAAACGSEDDFDACLAICFFIMATSSSDSLSALSTSCPRPRALSNNSLDRPYCCYSPYSFSSRLSVLVLTLYSSSVGTILLRLVSLHVPRRIHFLFPFPLVTDPTPFSKSPTGRGLIHSSLLTFLDDVSCPISRTFLSPKPILLYRLVIHITHTIPWCSLSFYDYASLCT
jgi:hypothetical protein